MLHHQASLGRAERIFEFVWKKCETLRICETPVSTFFASHRRSPCEPQRLRTACRAPATGLPAAQPHSLRRQLVGSAWTRARRDGNPTHGASTRLRFCNKVCLACAGDAQSSRDDAGSLGSTSKADLVAKNLCSIRRWFTVDVCVGKLSRRLRPPKTVYEGTPEEAPISSTQVYDGSFVLSGELRRWPGHRHRL